ncbi:SSI family serine proteinase inhibitor [Streptomyces sp. NPDC027717]|uniref:SSI family serine proteinase inhibitor n=1 Tax=Streptomyces sp. NPDC027717 TaxID=3155765 RepID=UPI0034034EA9
MTYLNRTAAVAAALMTTCLLAPGPSAHAVSRDASTGDWLRLTVTHGDSASSDTRGTLLLCDPPQGHAHAEEACAELAAVDGDISRLTPSDTLCTLIYAPVTAQAEGRWGGRRVEHHETYANDCVLRAETGAVFALDD